MTPRELETPIDLDWTGESWSRSELMARARSQRILNLVKAELRSLAEEVVALASEKEDEGPDPHSSLWHAVCHQVARGTKEDLKRCEAVVAELCMSALDDWVGFPLECLATCSEESDAFHRTAMRNERPPGHLLKQWAARAVLKEVVVLAENDASIGPLSFDPCLLDPLIECVRSLIPLAQSGLDLIALGQVINIIELFKRGREGGLSLDIGCGYLAGHPDAQDGVTALVEIRPAGITLLLLHTQYDPGVGSDHWSEHFSFDEDGLTRWREIFDVVRQDERVRLTARDPMA